VNICFLIFIYNLIKHNIEYNILNVHHDYIFNTLCHETLSVISFAKI